MRLARYHSGEKKQEYAPAMVRMGSMMMNIMAKGRGRTRDMLEGYTVVVSKHVDGISGGGKLTSVTTMSPPVVLVTGASRGLGLGIVKALIQSYSARVVVLSRSKSSELSSLPSTSLHFIQCDITQEGTAKSAVTETIKQFGRLDSIVLNAGTLDPVTKLENATSETWKECFHINVFANIPLIKECIPHLRSSHGSIILISSGAAINAYSGWSAYSASKAALNSLAQSIAEEEPDILSLAVRPGVVDTEMQNDIRTKHAEVMGKGHDKFVQLKKDGGLLSPDIVGKAIAGMAVCKNETIREYSGKFVTWDDKSIAAVL